MAGVDLNSTSAIEGVGVDGGGMVQHAWLAFASHFSPYVLLCVGTYVVNIFMHVVISIPYLLIDRFKVFQQYKIQKHVVNDYAEMRRSFVAMVLAQLVLAPLILPGYPLFTLCNFSYGALPGARSLFWQFVVFNLAEDAMFYWGHRLLHQPYWFKKVHHVHHRFTAPYSLVGGQAHWIEVVFNFVLPTVIPPFVWGYCTGDMHVLIFWLWLLFREIRATEAHCGYVLPWHLSHVLKYIGHHSAEAHDIHHSSTKFNLGSFVIWDLLCGSFATAADLAPGGKYARPASAARGAGSGAKHSGSKSPAVDAARARADETKSD